MGKDDFCPYISDAWKRQEDALEAERAKTAELLAALWKLYQVFPYTEGGYLTLSERAARQKAWRLLQKYEKK